MDLGPVVGLGQVATRARVLVHEVLDRGAQVVARGGARCASQALDRGTQADARGTAQVLVPPSAPERTWQASGSGQAIARLNGGLPCCSVPASTTRWAVKRRHAAAEETKKKEKRFIYMVPRPQPTATLN